MKTELNYKMLALSSAVGIILWFIPVPEGLKENAWHLFGIFVFVIMGIITKAAPMGTMAMLGIALSAFSTVLAPEDSVNPAKDSIVNALSGFGNSIIWLIGMAFFIARGFIKTGLGARIAYFFVQKFGRSTLGLAYGLNLADLLLAPAVPSNTARSGGIIYPIMKSVAMSLGSDAAKPETNKKAGTFLTLSTYNANLITSTMFLTGTASNPMAQKFAADLGISISWGSWAVAALVPGLLCLMVMPYVLYKVSPPDLKNTGDAPELARQKLREMGKMKPEEWIMIVAFLILLFLWIFGETVHIDATTTALLGLCFLLLTRVLTWEDVKSEKGAWDTVVWFSSLVMMASFLAKLGFIPWLSENIKDSISGMSWYYAFPIIILIYYYLHYMFASATAHVAALYYAMLSVGVAVGVPPDMLALFLGFCGGIFGTLTHYGHGPAPILYGSGYVTVNQWWKDGFLLSMVYLFIFFIIGGAWWKVLGLW
ncbi:divalent anion:Na+ symporter, DASS family [Sinomicrobium oceani]|uniref:Divalent anion:Na+ symporter, DASS family n=1 Tax=Sinomicrobium oceani TaxID=1150368 RepID=A0A1K1RDM9_9FLAO|nr:anion permease [Sinomicrobium oceani]SFW70049.1 divalent anion:Na+ symporter, DASS family [Sinomicrobium oceani]